LSYFDNGQLDEEELVLREVDSRPFPEKDPKNMKARRKRAFTTAR
jgi:hypothetical protein